MDYEKKISTHDTVRRIALLVATALILVGYLFLERIPWLIYTAAVPLLVMVFNTLMIKRYEKKQRAEEA